MRSLEGDVIRLMSLRSLFWKGSDLWVKWELVAPSCLVSLCCGWPWVPTMCLESSWCDGLAAVKCCWVDSMLNTESFQASTWSCIGSRGPEAVFSNVGGRLLFTNVNPPEMSLSGGTAFMNEF